MNESDRAPNSHATTIAVVFAFALLLLGVQSCHESASSEYSDKQIIRVGRERFLQGIDDARSVKILQESVVRPGRNGGNFGYWVRYQILNVDDEWVRKEHYDE